MQQPDPAPAGAGAQARAPRADPDRPHGTSSARRSCALPPRSGCSTCARTRGSAPPEDAHRMFAFVHVHGQPHHHEHRLPFLHRAARAAPGARDPTSACRCLQRMRDAQRQLADSDADPALAIVDSQHCSAESRAAAGRGSRLVRLNARVRHHAWPTSSDRRVRSIPSNCMAAGSRCSGARSKTTSRSAPTVSHEFCVSSCSSCPGAQPA